uniref:E3 ubiquitin-protein ligase n=1 Tax=Angiostrongylus cantonensis TaxID=6313 RepID=A0A158PBV7_ANGCA
MPKVNVIRSMEPGGIKAEDRRVKEKYRCLHSTIARSPTPANGNPLIMPSRKPNRPLVASLRLSRCAETRSDDEDASYCGELVFAILAGFPKGFSSYCDGAMRTIFSSLVKHTDQFAKGPRDVLSRSDFAKHTFPVTVWREMHMMRDHGYILTCVPSEENWNNQLKEQFIEGCQSLIRFLHRLQGMDEVKRQSAEHRVWELEWKTAFNIHSDLQHFLIFLETTSISDDEVHIRQQIRKMATILYEIPLRVLVLCAQAHAQLWRRNGFLLLNQIHNYYSPLCGTEMFDCDLLMMQVGAAIRLPTDFLLHILPFSSRSMG